MAILVRGLLQLAIRKRLVAYSGAKLPCIPVGKLPPIPESKLPPIPEEGCHPSKVDRWDFRIGRSLSETPHLVTFRIRS
jgi:hypothetical protein